MFSGVNPFAISASLSSEFRGKLEPFGRRSSRSDSSHELVGGSGKGGRAWLKFRFAGWLVGSGFGLSLSSARGQFVHSHMPKQKGSLRRLFSISPRVVSD